ncbi:triose-phosphate isomerase [Lottiidibacillus patelloidae]|uniref:Triosephosphate isomerase n=1 Tax=Lottiidibacillus patelloidae TaxID=2670334 RepID=A0A263BX30_9BACI|nr:triose-phosphate isomerase [Lottiidibacillus patelloidae]OZM58311.1 triose-phosphate isomerase [Lottiidibacillus patelloidae]
MTQSIESFIETIVRKTITEKFADTNIIDSKRRTVIAANWKMNMSLETAGSLITQLADTTYSNTVVVCPPYPYLYPVKLLLNQSTSNIQLGGQNVHEEDKGAHTGDISAEMLKDVGCEHVIIGHSERRMIGETDELVNNKVVKALEKKLTPIICIGETAEQYDQGLTKEVVSSQIQTALTGVTDLSDIVIAYEPVWAIGTGKSATAEQAQDIHEYIRSTIEKSHGVLADEVPILYGGSVKAKNAEEFSKMKDIDGVLVGGASLNAEEFKSIIQAFA